jgi:hypothetical protein
MWLPSRLSLIRLTGRGVSKITLYFLHTKVESVLTPMYFYEYKQSIVYA